jgi:hypothetical protein
MSFILKENEMKERRDERRDRRNKGPVMSRDEFKAKAQQDLQSAEAAAQIRGVSLAQIQLWELTAR